MHFHIAVVSCISYARKRVVCFTPTMLLTSTFSFLFSHTDLYSSESVALFFCLFQKERVAGVLALMREKLGITAALALKHVPEIERCIAVQ